MSILLFCVLLTYVLKISEFLKSGLELLQTTSVTMLMRIIGENDLIQIYTDQYLFYNNTLAVSIDSILGLRYYFIAACIVICMIDTTKNSIFSIFGLWVYIFSVSVFVICISSVHFNFLSKPEMLSFYFETIIVTSLIGYIFLLRRFLLNTQKHNYVFSLGESLHLPYYFGVLLLGVLSQIVLYYSYFKDYLANTILYSSKIILHFLGYSPYVSSRFIRGDNAWIGVMNPCLGINILLTFLFVMLLFKGRVQRKIPYILVGLVAIVFINIIRIVGLYVYVSENGGSYDGFINTHDIYNYPVYVAVVIIWAIYLYREYAVKVQR